MLPAAIVCAAVFVASMGAFAATTYTWRGVGLSREPVWQYVLPNVLLDGNKNHPSPV